ncbi:MAG: hypothetical protein WAN48_05080 [Actinomycetes bacterium]
MAEQTVVLHVGAMKTGTSFIQAVLEKNRDVLSAQGVLWPGRTWGDQVRAVNDVKARRTAGPPTAPDRWDRMVEQIHASPSELAVISMEALAGSAPRTVATVVHSLAPSQVRVVLTLRDLGRTLPAQWQESVQNGYVWTYSEYLAGVTAQNSSESEAGAHFWKRQTWPRIVARWTEAVGRDHLNVVTVPPAGSPHTLLWERFCEATGLDAGRYDTDARSNESIGAAAAELMRRINERVTADSEAPPSSALKQTLAKRVLAAHRSDEPSLVLPERNHAWAVRESERLIGELAAQSPKVIGDLAELSPSFATPRGATTDDPSSLPTDELLDTAVFGVLGLAQVIAADKGSRT